MRASHLFNDTTASPLISGSISICTQVFPAEASISGGVEDACAESHDLPAAQRVCRGSPCPTRCIPRLPLPLLALLPLEVEQLELNLSRTHHSSNNSSVFGMAALGPAPIGVDDVETTSFETLTSFVMRTQQDRELVLFMQAMQVQNHAVTTADPRPHCCRCDHRRL